MTLSSEREARLRLAQDLGQLPADGFLIRNASRLTDFREGDTTHGWRAWRVGLVAPEVHAIHNSELPYSLNDGALWAGRGWNQEISAGVFADIGPLRVLFVPTRLAEDNEIFQTIPFVASPTEQRSQWANPFYGLPESIDMPLRFGDQRIERTDWGQTGVTVNARGVSFGMSNESLWWGPGIENAILLSDNAPGFPHLFVQMRQPAHTRIGTIDAQWILGQLTESDFFDNDPTDNHRALNGVVATLRPAFDSAFTVGAGRLVMAAENSGWFPLGDGLDILRTVGHADADTLAPLPAKRMDQIFSLFGRWVLVPAGLETYVEWARFEEPISLQDFLEFPGHSEAYTLGLQWAHPLDLDLGRRFRPILQLQAEASYLEPDPSARLRNVAATYTSRTVPQGFTQEGQPLGAAIGPGSSSQWLSADLFGSRWRLGGYLSRIRWNNGVLFEPEVPQLRRADVTLLAGLRASLSWREQTLAVDFSHAARFDYLFQAFVLTPPHTGGIDLINNTLSITLSTGVGHR